MSDPLSTFEQTPRPYQAAAIEDAIEFACNAKPGERRLYAAPCGAGKGSLQLHLRNELDPTPIIITPSLEIIRGYFARCGVDVSGYSQGLLQNLAESCGIYTPVTARNRLMDNKLDAPECVLVDEAHHNLETNGTVSGDLFALWPEAIWLGFSATPYRASPKQTAKLKEAWGEPHVVATLPQLIDLGHVALPRFEVVPLLDDDKVVVKDGQFNISGKGGLNPLLKSRSGDLAALIECRSEWNGKSTDVPTCVAVPSTESAKQLCRDLDSLGVVSRFVGQETKAKDRGEAYEMCKRHHCVLVVIGVLAEGADFPWLCRLIDAKPTQSPVAFMQLIGRVMRPGEDKEVLVTCRNLERHSYLLAGAIPSSVIREAQTAFEKPSKRQAVRSVGYEALTRFKALRFPTLEGCEGYQYALCSFDERGTKTEYSVVSSPFKPELLYAWRQVPLKPNGEKDYKHPLAKWKRCDSLPDLEGFATSPYRGPLSANQLRWWKRSAKRFGLDPDAADSVTQREFAVLPVLNDTRQSLYPKAS